MQIPTTLPVHEQLSRRPHDRVALHRNDEEWLAARWADDSSRVLVVAGNRVRRVDAAGAVQWVSPRQAPPGERLLLGERDGHTWFAVVVPPERADDDWVPLRGVLPALAASERAEAPLVLHALGLAEWLRVTRFCSRCGGPLVVQSAGHELRCTDGHVHYPRTDPAVIMLISHGEPGSPEERCLLGRQAVWPTGRFSTLAGFCEPGESLEDAVRREVAEETGVRVGEVHYFGNQPWPFPASLMLGMTGLAETVDIHPDVDEIEDARWFTREELRAGAESGELILPGGVSISRSLVEAWYGGPLPGSW